jgi:hypothetical protein
MKTKSYYIILFFFLLTNIKSQNTNLSDSIISNFFTITLNLKKSKDILYIATDSVIFVNKNFTKNKYVKIIDSTFNVNYHIKKKQYFAKLTNLTIEYIDGVSLYKLNYDIQKLINISKEKNIWKSEGSYIFNVFIDAKKNMNRIEFIGGIIPFIIYKKS